ncbi:retrovirus-related Pol polyprotein from transposon 297 [Trichonephila clavipes]|nr:retrovirus-related Pol polyprotein from transposon 297 [Trichonephila clavipes]
MVEMVIGVTMRIAVKEISGSKAGIGFKTMIEDLTIGDISLEIEVKMTILEEGIKEIEIDKVVKTVEVEKVEIDLSKTKIEEKQKRELQDLFDGFQKLFSDKPMLTHVLYHEINTGDNPPVVSRPYRKNNRLPSDNPEDYRFAVDYRKLNEITKYPRYPLPLIDDLIMNIPHTGIMSVLDLRLGYFQMAVNPSDIVKTAFVTKNDTYAFRRMPFGLSGVAPDFQKAIDIILKPVIGKFVNVYIDDVIISSPSFTQHIEHLKEVLRLLHEAGLTLNIYFICWLHVKKIQK